MSGIIMKRTFVVMLWSGPKAKATTVQVKQITLYGIEKSGVGKFTRSDSVYNWTSSYRSAGFESSKIEVL